MAKRRSGARVGDGNVLVCEDGGLGAPNRLLIVPGGLGAADLTNTVTVNNVDATYTVRRTGAR